jgi:hypothetical protein
MNDRELHQNSDLKGSNDTPEGKIVAPRGSDKANSPSFNDVQSILAYLDQLDPKTKVRIVFKDYELWREFLPLSDKYKSKFFKFAEKKDFIMSSNLAVDKKENITLKESLINWIEKNNVPEKIKKILLEEIK